jgi:hypothetical protein
MIFPLGLYPELTNISRTDEQIAFGSAQCSKGTLRCTLLVYATLDEFSELLAQPADWGISQGGNLAMKGARQPAGNSPFTIHYSL